VSRVEKGLLASHKGWEKDRRLSSAMKVPHGKICLLVLVGVWMMSGILWGWEDPEKKISPLLVTRQVLTEYIEDRLRQLERKEELTEQEAGELDFIRENRDDLKSLADFYEMEIKETKEDGTARQAQPTVESPGGEENYTVILGSFKTGTQADRYVEELQEQGREAFRWHVELPDKGRWHRVCIGNFSTREEAELLARGLDQNGLETFVAEFSTRQEPPDMP
jgi:hypothetical protein